MTFHDEVHRDMEIAAYDAVRTLQLWLGTIAPITGAQSIELNNKLVDLCNTMKWSMEEDIYIGLILKERK